MATQKDPVCGKCGVNVLIGRTRMTKKRANWVPGVMAMHPGAEPWCANCVEKEDARMVKEEQHPSGRYGHFKTLPKYME